MNVGEYTKRAFIFIGFVMVLCQVQAAAGQGNIHVDKNRALPDFPDTITFQITASSETEIERLVLHYGTDALNCQGTGAQQPIRIDPTDEIEEEWQWELKRSGSVPPGANIWWQWELTDTDGNTFTTERQEFELVDDRYQWRNLTREEVTLHWFNGDDNFAEDTIVRARAELERISDEAGVSLPGEIQLWAYPTAADVRDALVISQEWAGAVAFSDYNIMIVSLAPGQTDWAAEVIAHEMMHLVIGMSAFNCRGGHLPVWLNEGLAVSAEGPVTVDDRERIEKALEEERLPPLRSLADGFSAYSGGARLAYAQSGEVTRYLLDQYGPEQIDALITSVRTGMTIDGALETVYGFDTDGLDVEWRHAQGYESFPTSTDASDLPATTPTAIATLPLINPAQTSPTATPPPPVTETTAETPQSSQQEPSQTPIQATDTPVATEIAAVSTLSESSIEPTPEQASTSNDESNSPNLAIWLGVIGLLVMAILAIGFLVRRKGA
jgi:hypothetical protein